jgi:hypothetical protein
MTSGEWLIVWTGVLWTALILFAGLVLVVSIGGAFDIRAMIRQIREQHREGPSDAP